MILEAFNRILDQEFAQQDLIREEIKQRGSYWAAREIWALRRQAAALRKRVANDEGAPPS